MKTRSGFGLPVAVGLLLAAGAALGQTASTKPAFEVATVKPSPPLDMNKMREQVQAGRMPRFGPHIDGAQATYTYMPLKELIANAYQVKAYQIAGPSWLATERFDIMAKLPDGATKDDAPGMLKALLEERFKLGAHRDTQEQPVLALVVAKDGPKLKEAPPIAPVDENAPLKPGEVKVDTPTGPMRVSRNPDGSTTMNMGEKGTITTRMDMETQSLSLESSSVTMSGFADRLTSILQMGGGEGRQVVDMTGLKGNYQVTLEISLADIMAMARAQGFNVPPAAAGSGVPGGGAPGASPAPEASDPGGGSTVFASVKKLGLRLEPRRAPVERLIIDNVEKTPAEN
jgi:uncharacterized protein (TIGR03435 family)